ncbi:MAG: radical SAM protein [Candidatus Riflebacteria bacterium]|nr:radical SAM protein [Candidatus Riflebacteria bacterium]
MINVSKLYAGFLSTGDSLRYGVPGGDHRISKTASERRPVVVWNATRRCNLKCVHCYSESENHEYEGELSFSEGIDLIKDLSAFGAPALLFSGGEPLFRKDIFELASFAAKNNVRPVLSTNGTLIDLPTARKLKETGFIYAGISLDGTGEANDKFRGVTGAFEAAVKGFRNCIEVGQRVGLRLTLTKRNVAELDKIFDFILEERIPRVCFYHFVPAGRGKEMSSDDLSHDDTRKAIDIICARTLDAVEKGIDLDVLTVDNHVDGPYIYQKILKEKPERAAEVKKLLEWNGGGAASSGVSIGCIGPTGNVHPDQFWREEILGNIRSENFSKIWQNTDNPLMAGLKNRIPLLKGKCSGCEYVKMCGGSLRVRAVRAFGDPWMHDPACYI